MARPFFLLITRLALVAGAALFAGRAVAQDLSWQHTEGKSLTLLRNDEVVWTFHYGPERAKPCFHPLALPGNRVLTCDQPADHRWHHGLWFSWKYIDGVNYWENDGKTGRPIGRTTWQVVELEPDEDGRARIVLDVAYAPPNGEPVVRERRLVETSPPAADGTFAIDWQGTFAAQADCTLDRTPLPGEPGGQAYGGYAGLSLRLVQLEDRDALTTDGPVKWNAQNRFRSEARAFDYRGTLANQEVGVAIFDHPDNPRAPTPWYAIRSPAMSFFSPAVLCRQPLQVKKGDRFTLRYRVLVHPGRLDEDRLAAAAAEYSSGPLLRVERDDAKGHALVCAGDRVVVGWQYDARYAIPHWFPLRSPSGKDLLAQHPDPFPHHRAMWIADKVQLGDGEVVDFYHCFKNQVDSEDPGEGYRHFIRQRALPRCEVSGERAVIESRLQWIVDGEQPVLDDERTFTVRALAGGEAQIDIAWTLRASHGVVTFHSDWVHYAWPYLRIHPQFSVQHGGRLVDDRGRVGQEETNGKYPHWVDYSNTIDGVTEGVAVFVPDDGAQRKWLTRDYGTFGPRRPDAQSGTKFTLAKGEEVKGSVRLFVHRGDAETGGVAARYREYLEETSR